MKTFFLPLFAVFFFCQASLAEPELCGKWKMEDFGSVIEIFRQNDMFYGKITKVSDNDKKHKVGQMLLTDIVYVASLNKYKGQVNAANNITADGELEFINENKLQLTVKRLFLKKIKTFFRIE